MLAIRVPALFLVLSALLCAKITIGSPQQPDLIIYKGDTLPVYRLIVEDYLQKNNKRQGQSLFGFQFRDDGYDIGLNCWRGYRAIYTITNDSLFVSYIIACRGIDRGIEIDSVSSERKLKEFFGEKVKNGKVHADWFTGPLGLPAGETLRWDGIFHVDFEKETLLTIKNGSVKSTELVENYIDFPDRINRRYGDSVSTIIFKELKKVRWQSIDKFDCSEAYYIHIGKNGNVKGVSMYSYRTKEDIKGAWDRKEYNYCVKTIYRAVKHLKFDILKRDGVPIEEEIYIDIFFDEETGLEDFIGNT